MADTWCTQNGVRKAVKVCTGNSATCECGTVQHHLRQRAEVIPERCPHGVRWDASCAACGVLAVDPLDRAKQIRDRVAELEAEVQRLVAEHESLTGGPWGKVDADDIAWATDKASTEGNTNG